MFVDSQDILLSLQFLEKPFVVACGPVFNCIQDLKERGTTLVVDPIVNPKKFFMSLPSYLDQSLLFKALKQKARVFTKSKEEELTQFLTEWNSKSLYEYLKDFPDSLNQSPYCYLTSRTLDRTVTKTNCPVIQEPFGEPLCTREAVMANVLKTLSIN